MNMTLFLICPLSPLCPTHTHDHKACHSLLLGTLQSESLAPSQPDPFAFPFFYPSPGKLTTTSSLGCSAHFLPCGCSSQSYFLLRERPGILPLNCLLISPFLKLKFSKELPKPRSTKASWNTKGKKKITPQMNSLVHDLVTEYIAVPLFLSLFLWEIIEQYSKRFQLSCII